MAGSTATPRGQLKSPVLVKPRWPQMLIRVPVGVEDGDALIHRVHRDDVARRVEATCPRTWLNTEVLVLPGGTIGLGMVWSYV